MKIKSNLKSGSLNLNPQKGNMPLYAAHIASGYNRYATLFWSVFGPTDRYNFGYCRYRYAYCA